MTVGGVEPVAYDLKAAAAAVCVSADTLRRQIRAGHLRARRVAGKDLVLRSDLEAWVIAQPDSPLYDRNWMQP